jgi:hypothetical protein
VVNTKNYFHTIDENTKLNSHHARVKWDGGKNSASQNLLAIDCWTGWYTYSHLRSGSLKFRRVVGYEDITLSVRQAGRHRTLGRRSSTLLIFFAFLSSRINLLSAVLEPRQGMAKLKGHFV